MAQIAAIFDEYYAVDISQRRKANIAYKKAQNKTIGIPPFGTKRDSEGYLIPSDEGVWFIADGTWQAGKVGEEPPTPNSVWRGYFDCVHRILNLYIIGNASARICIIMREEGWAFRSRSGLPSILEKDDIRRVTKAWIEYGGIVIGRRAKDRPGYSINPDEIVLDEKRAVFDIALLTRVGQVDAERSIRQPHRGHNVAARVYPLAGLVYCAHCDNIAERNNNPTLRSRLIGKAKTAERKGSYRHRPGLECGSGRKQVYSADIEGDFIRLCQLLTLDDAAFAAMEHLVADMLNLDQASQDEMKKKRDVAIAKCRRRLDAARSLFEDGDLDREEYLRRKQHIEHELVQWQNYTTETETMSQQLAMCADAMTKLASLWSDSTDEGKRGLAHNLFEELVYDLDKQQIVDFRLKAWAEQFLILRGQLYEDGNWRYGYAPSRNRICAFASGGQRSIR